MSAATAGIGGGGRQEEEEQQRSLHIVMLPWLAFGHLLPFLELSKRLAGKGHRISFISTPRNIDRLPKVPSDLAPRIRLVRLPLPRVDLLPDDVEATIDISSDELRPLLNRAFDGLKPHVAAFLSSAGSPPPDWIVHDVASCWAPELGFPCVFLNLFNAATSCFFSRDWSNAEDFTVPPAWVTESVPSSSIVLRPHEARQFWSAVSIPRPKKTDPPAANDSGHEISALIQRSHFVAIRSCEEFEGEWVPLLKKVLVMPALPVGFFPPLTLTDGGGEKSSQLGAEENGGSSVLEWLDQQAPASVVYAAFGSEVRLSRDAVMAIADGFERSELKFLWVFRKPPGVADDEDMFPEGFEERTTSRRQGLLCKNWVPQSRILAHSSVGGFLTHCGWNSVIEGLQFGLPLVLLPMILDQPLNARLLEEKGVGVEVPRDVEDGTFGGEDVAKTLRLVMVDAEGETVRAKAREVRDAVFGNEELQDQYLNRFVEHLLNSSPPRRRRHRQRRRRCRHLTRGPLS